MHPSRLDAYTRHPEPCPRCVAWAREELPVERDHGLAEMVQPLPEGALAPLARDGSGPCCRDCALADGLLSVAIRGTRFPRVEFLLASRWGRHRRNDVPGGLTWEMLRLAVGNDRREQLRLPGAPMGLVLSGLQPSEPGELDTHRRWTDRHLLTLIPGGTFDG